MDFIERSIEITESFYLSCKNCELIRRFEYTENNGFICTGIIKHPYKSIPFDVIRICKGSDDNEYIDCHDFAPDEALTYAELLTSATKTWLLENTKYIDFRKEKSK